MTDTTAAETPAEKPAKAPKAPKEPKAPKPQNRYWVGPTASREGAVYNRLQVIVAQNPGLNRDEIIAKLKEGGFAAKNSKKFEENPEQFIGGYLTAGERKEFFVTSEDKAVAAPNVTTVTKKEPAEKGPSVSETGRNVLNALQGIEVGSGLPIKEIAEGLGKTKTQLSRTIDKLVKDKMIEVDTVGEGDEATDYAYVLQGGYDIANAPAQ